LAGQVLITEPIEESRVRLTASAPDAARPGGAPRLVIACSWAVDATWVTSQRIPALGRRIAMTCSFHLDPDMSPTRHIAV
jgi:hypothetical protein